MAANIVEEDEKLPTQKECLRRVNIALININQSCESVVKNNEKTLNLLENICDALKPYAPDCCDSSNQIILTIRNHLLKKSKTCQDNLDASGKKKGELVARKEAANKKMVELKNCIDLLMAEEREMKTIVESNKHQPILLKLMENVQ